MRVVILQSVAGETVITSVYSMDRKEVIIGFALLYILALCLVGAIFLHYSWHWMGGRSIYRMRLLPHRRELWRRVLTIPLAGLAACVILWGLLLLLCALYYRFATPEGHLPINCWGTLPFTWMGGYHA